MSREKSTEKLELKLLGSPEVRLDGQVVTGFRSGKARALLYYLVVTGRAQPRSVLAGLFWGGVAENHARRSLTMTLSNLRRLVGRHLEIGRETIAFKLDSPYELDVTAFEAGVEAKADAINVEGLKRAIALYRGDFLEGFYLQDAPEFEQWVLIERTRLRERVLQALHILADHLAAQNDLPQAIETMRRLLALEPWREEAHRYLMLLLARDGQRSTALAQFEICRQMLADELDVEPGSETTTLYDAIRTKQFMPAETPALLAELKPHEHYLAVEVPAAGSSSEIDRDQDRLTGQLQPGQLKKVPSNSIIVLPFVNLSADPDNEYFCDGLAEDLINALTNIGALRVVARATAFSFKGRQIDIRHIGEKLNVNTVLEGSVRKIGDRLRITIQLSRVADGYHIWSERYDRKMDDVFAIQDEISLTVAQKLKIELLKEEKQAVVKHYTDNIEAYHLYLKGRYFIYTKKGNEFFKKAIKTDPTYALAYAGLADSYSGLGLLAFLPPESFAKARTAARKALKIDNTLAEAHCSLGLIYFWLDHDWPKAAREFEQAIALNPNYAPARQWYAVFLVWLGHVDEAIAEIKQAQQLDPLSPVTQALVGFIYYCARDFNEAIRQGKAALEIDANSVLALYLIALPYKEMGTFDEAIAELQQAVTISRRHAFFLGLLGHVYGISGQSEKARLLLDELEQKEKETYVTPLTYAWIYLGLADNDQAVIWFEKAFEAGQAPYHIFLGDSIYDGIRAHPRFKKILQQIGLDRWAFSEAGSRAENEIQRPFASLSTGPTGPRHNLLPQPTSFVGRERELADIIRRLMDRDCRLLTLVGPGGIGKTRLALQTAQRLIDSDSDRDLFEDGVLFVPLAAVESINGLVSAVAEAANLTFHSNTPPKQQLLDFLQEKEMLLVLDNLEHLLSAPQEENGTDTIAGGEPAEGAVKLIAEILTAAPNLKILVTSREALNLQEAWFHPVKGLSFPPRQQPFAAGSEAANSSNNVSLEQYGAVQLFIQSAARARVEFSLATERAAVEHICRLVEGIPLAIELAAGWLKTLPLDKIAAEIERDLDVLTTRHQNVPERHRSMRVVLTQSWQRLTASEREVFNRLSVFRGGFAADAARTVAGASLIDLATFVDKSLLQLTSTGRYHMHGLLRQYAAERLAASPENVAQTYEAHCTYYADFLQQRSDVLMGGQQRGALAAITAEYDNVWAAWRWALNGLKLVEIQKLIMPLQLHSQFQSRYLEAAEAWGEAYRRLTGVEGTDPVKIVLVEVIAWWGWMLIRLGRLDQAEKVLKQGCDLYTQLGIPAVPGYGTNPRLPLSLIATIRGDYATALQYGEQARQESETHRHQVNLCEAYYVLASAASGQGDYETAQRYARQAYNLARIRGDHWYEAFCLNELGNIALALGDIATAQHHFEASYTLRKEFDDPGGMAIALNYLGEIALRQQDYEQARHLYQASLDVYQNIFDKGGLAGAYQGLGTVASRQGDLQTAQPYLQQALQLTMEIEYVPLTLSILNITGDLLLKSNRPEQGLMVLAFVQQQAQGNLAAQDEAHKRLDKFKATAQKEQLELLEMAQEQAKNQTLAGVATGVIEALEGQNIFQNRENVLALPAASSGVAHNFPLQTTPFIGRKKEIADILRKLSDPDCRLLSLIGPGGIGKTRLAVETATRGLKSKEMSWATEFSDGIYFVSLAAISPDLDLVTSGSVTSGGSLIGRSAHAFVSTIAQAIGFSFHGPTDLVGQVLNYLCPKKMLLILDNYEHLLKCIDLIENILQRAPHIKLLVTSRERLNLPAEWVLEVDGLDYPASTLSNVDYHDFSAIAYFVQRAQQMSSGFTLSEADLLHVVQICRLVEGVPLALELAANWLPALTCAEIAQEIEHNLDFLDKPVRNAPARHQSLRTIFERSWQILSKEEQRVLRKLSVFRGGCQPQAAKQVARASLSTLARLMDKSLLRRSLTGRYELHELVRQYAAEKLWVETTPAGPSKLARQVWQAHSTYYLRFIGRQEKLLRGASPQETLAIIRPELENIRQAWRWALIEENFDDIDDALAGLSRFCDLTGLFAEGESIFAQMAAQVQADLGPTAPLPKTRQKICCRLLIEQARMLHRQGRAQQGVQVAQKATELAQALDSISLEALARHQWGDNLSLSSQLEAARVQLEQALQLAQTAQLPGVEVEAMRDLGIVSVHQSDYSAARTLHEQALSLFEALEDRRGATIILMNLATLNSKLGDYTQVQPTYEQALQNFIEMEDRWGEALVTINLGDHFYEEGNYTAALAQSQHGLQLCQQLQDHANEGIVTENLGHILCDLGDYTGAQRYYEQALAIAREIDDRREEGRALSHLGLVYHHLGRSEMAYDTCQQARQLIEEAGEQEAQALVLTYLGQIMLAADQPDKAAEVYQQALALRQAAGEAQRVIVPLAGLAKVALIQGELPQALAYTEEILTYLQTKGVTGIAGLFQIYLTCYHTLQANQDPRAETILSTAYHLLQERAANIDDERLRRLFLENVPAHRAIIEEMNK